MLEERPIEVIYLETAVRNFRGLKSLAEKALAQLDDQDLHWVPEPESNSIALIMKHLAGNLLSRWTDFLSTDGEKPDRDRDDEFVDHSETRQQLTERWTAGWTQLLVTVEALTADDLRKVVTIRGEPHSVVLAVNRQISHCAYHVGQLVYVAKLIRGERWSNLSMPKRR